MIDADYWPLKLCISINNKDKMRTRLMSKNILRDIWSSSAIKNVLFISANKAFIDLIVRIIPEGEFKAKAIFFLNDGTFSFIYDIKTITLG